MFPYRAIVSAHSINQTQKLLSLHRHYDHTIRITNNRPKTNSPSRTTNNNVNSRKPVEKGQTIDSLSLC